MANRLTKDKAMLIASEYFTNGFNKIEALLSAGYSDTYARHIGLKLFVNDRVLKAMERLSAVAVIKTGYSIELAQAEYEQARVQAIQIKQPSAAVSAITGKARLHGMDKDAGSTQESPNELTPERIKELLKLSKDLQVKELSKEESDENRNKIGVA